MTPWGDKILLPFPGSSTTTILLKLIIQNLSHIINQVVDECWAMLTSCFSKKGRMSSRAWWPIVECSCSNVLAAASRTSSRGSHSAFLTVGTRDSEKSSTCRWRDKITEHLKHNKHTYLSKVAKNAEFAQLKLNCSSLRIILEEKPDPSAQIVAVL